MLCMAIRMMVLAFMPDSPSLLTIVWRSVCRAKSGAKIGPAGGGLAGVSGYGDGGLGLHATIR
jgi:hypothetical protein